MATKLQRKLLWQMIACDGRALIITGRKSTDWEDRLKTGPVIIRCSDCVLFGLTSNRYIAKETTVYSSSHADHTYSITDTGIKAAGKREPEMKALSHGAHGIRWG